MATLHRSTLTGLDHDVPSVEAVWDALQQAIELEHSTIPVYLYSLFSLDPDKNRGTVDIIRSVVVEEMLHMVLAANVLNALGGSPAISKHDFIPAYPGPLPGGVEGQLRLHLRPFSMDQLEAFILIEEPHAPIDYAAHAALVEVPAVTIGEFYLSISRAIQRLPAEAFVQPPRNQIGPELMFGSIAVTDAESAVRAIETIIEQGEGTTTSPEEIDGPNGSDDFAHFYRFMELKMGRRLVKVSDATSPFSSYEYSGEVVEVDPSGIYDLPVDPSSRHYPVGSEARRMNDEFNLTYSKMLAQLHELLNGSADLDTFMASLAMMSSLERQARAMASGEANGGIAVGPSFEVPAGRS